MQFNHLIEINQPLLSLVDVLTHAQLWQGLVLRAEMPKLFVPYLDGCTISARSETGFARALQYGDLVINDVVTLAAPNQILYSVPAQKDIPASSLTVTIEEPQPDVFYVRFAYDDGQSEAADSVDAFYNEYRRSAYEEADIDTIRLIRQMVQDGQLR
ncbi:hypothetical protein RCH09_000894 [Actimicrobium sp. GrIS 1.19]|uniref:SRPBCC family protein n=1 Tax=Actimicrobium sp. GrIS 1.19 TaxID=3071708 RepID=UPI002DFCCE72|nr:hypothetical protein [Actimicrobium sp. GrIS 1.19]